ncbi:hypothetical protein ACET3Z_018677 [Daucus carota]
MQLMGANRNFSGLKWSKCAHILSSSLVKVKVHQVLLPLPPRICEKVRQYGLLIVILRKYRMPLVLS